MVAEPSPTPQAVDQADQQPGAPNGAPAIQANNPQTESSPATSGTPAGAGTAAANGPTEQIPLDARLVGDWDGKPNGSKGGWDRHWEQQSDGSYMMRGVVTESGTLIAHDGKLEKTLDGTGEVVEVLYTFNGNTLMTTEADGSTVVWRQENATPAHSKPSHSLDSKTKHTKHAPQSPGHPGGFWQNLRKYFP